MREAIPSHHIHNMAVQPQRMNDGQRLKKMLRIANESNSGKRNNPAGNTAGRMWEAVIKGIEVSQFPILGQEKTQNSGKYVKIMLDEGGLNINEAHPIQVGQILKQYFCGHSEQQKSKNCIILRTKDSKQFQSVMALKNDIFVTLNGVQKKVIIEELKAKNECCGIVFEASWRQLEEQEIMDELTNEGYEVKAVRQLKRKLQDGTEMKTNGCLVTLGGDELPDRIKMCGVSYRIRKYYPNPLICGKCQKIGHIRAKCSFLYDVCRSCGGQWEAGHECSAPICPNCPTDDNCHAPNSKTCPAVEFERLIINFKVNHKCSFGKAKQEVTKILQKVERPWCENQVKQPSANAPQQASSTIQKKAEDSGNELVELKEKLRQAKNQRTELEKLNLELRTELQAIERLQKENEILMTKIQQKQQTQLTESATSMDNEKPKRQAARDESNSRKKLQRISIFIENPRKQHPNNTKPLTLTELKQVETQLDTKQKNKIQSLTQKALNKSMELQWYKEGDVLYPVEVAIGDPGL